MNYNNYLQNQSQQSYPQGYTQQPVAEESEESDEEESLEDSSESSEEESDNNRLFNIFKDYIKPYEKELKSLDSSKDEDNIKCMKAFIKDVKNSFYENCVGPVISEVLNRNIVIKETEIEGMEAFLKDSKSLFKENIYIINLLYNKMNNKAVNYFNDHFILTNNPEDKIKINGIIKQLGLNKDQRYQGRDFPKWFIDNKINSDPIVKLENGHYYLYEYRSVDGKTIGLNEEPEYFSGLENLDDYTTEDKRDTMSAITGLTGITIDDINTIINENYSKLEEKINLLQNEITNNNFEVVTYRTASEYEKGYNKGKKEENVKYFNDGYSRGHKKGFDDGYKIGVEETIKINTNKYKKLESQLLEAQTTITRIRTRENLLITTNPINLQNAFNDGYNKGGNENQQNIFNEGVKQGQINLEKSILKNPDVIINWLEENNLI